MGFLSNFVSLAAPIVGGMIGGPPGAAIGGLVGGMASSIGGAEAQRRGTSQAADAQRGGINSAIDLFYKNQGEKGELVSPWVMAGKRGLAGLEQTIGQYQNALMNPGAYAQTGDFKYRQKEIENAMLRGASAGGRLDEGGLPLDFGKQAAGMAATGQQNYLQNILAGSNLQGNLATKGLEATGMQIRSDDATTANIGNALIGGGQVGADEAIRKTNAETGLYENLGNLGNQMVGMPWDSFGNNNALTSGSGWKPSPEYGYGYGR